MSNSTTKSPTSTRVSFASRKGTDLASELESLLGAMVCEHETWRGLIDSHRVALKKADGDAVQDAVIQQSRVLQTIADLEEKRRRLVDRAIATEGILGKGSGAIAARPVAAASTSSTAPLARVGPVTLSQIAGSLPEPSRTRLLELAGRLRFLLGDIENQNRTLRMATNSLIVHMEGLMRQVARRLSHSGTYGRKGYVDSVPTVISAVDLTR